MGRGKLPMQLIADKKARLERFESRKKGLEKAAHKLSTLCDVNIGMIIYGPAQGKDSDQPIIWPRNQEAVAGLIESYKSRLGYDGGNKTYSLSDYFKDKTDKAEGELEKLRKEVREMKYPMPDEDKYNCMSLEELIQFHGGLMAKIDAVRGRINEMKGSTSLFTESYFLTNRYYSIQGSGVHVSPGMWNYDQLADCDSLQANTDNQMMTMMMMMMMNNGALCRQGSYSSYDDAYGLDEIGVQSVGLGTEITENDMHGFHENLMHSLDENLISNYAYGFGTETTENVITAEQLMSYNAQNVEPWRSYF